MIDDDMSVPSFERPHSSLSRYVAATVFYNTFTKRIRRISVAGQDALSDTEKDVIYIKQSPNAFVDYEDEGKDTMVLM